MVQGMQQAVGGNRRSASPLGSIHNQYPHLNHKDTKSYMNVSYMDVTFLRMDNFSYYILD
jgi:hypothetical protein